MAMHAMQASMERRRLKSWQESEDAACCVSLLVDVFNQLLGE